MAAAVSGQDSGAAAVRQGNHSVQMDRRRHTVITGVSDVCSFQENEAVLKVETGLMVLTGEGLHMAKLLRTPTADGGCVNTVQVQAEPVFRL